MSDRPEKERSDIPEPAPLTVGRLRLEAIPWGRARGLSQNGGYIAAYDGATDQELWLIKVYDVVYDGDKEDDKCDVFIADLALGSDGRVRVTDERGGVYLVDIERRSVVPVQDDLS